MTLPPGPSPDEFLPLDAAPDDPTPSEIRRACEQIQASWSEHERRCRATVLRPADLDERGDNSHYSRA